MRHHKSPRFPARCLFGARAIRLIQQDTEKKSGKSIRDCFYACTPVISKTISLCEGSFGAAAAAKCFFPTQDSFTWLRDNSPISLSSSFILAHNRTSCFSVDTMWAATISFSEVDTQKAPTITFKGERLKNRTWVDVNVTGYCDVSFSIPSHLSRSPAFIDYFNFVSCIETEKKALRTQPWTIFYR